MFTLLFFFPCCIRPHFFQSLWPEPCFCVSLHSSVSDSPVLCHQELGPWTVWKVTLCSSGMWVQPLGILLPLVLLNSALGIQECWWPVASHLMCVVDSYLWSVVRKQGWAQGLRLHWKQSSTLSSCALSPSIKILLSLTHTCLEVKEGMCGTREASERAYGDSCSQRLWE